MEILPPTLRERVLESERFGIGILSDYLGVERSTIEHISEDDEQSPIDLALGGITFDVKFASPSIDSNHKKQKLWSFDLRYKEDYCDYLVLIGMMDDLPEVVFVVPGSVAPKRNLRISISGRSKWHPYRVWGKQFETKPFVNSNGIKLLHTRACRYCGVAIPSKKHVFCTTQCARSEVDDRRRAGRESCHRCDARGSNKVVFIRPIQHGGRREERNKMVLCLDCNDAYQELITQSYFWK